MHWTPASVAGFAPVDTDIGSLFASGHPAPLSRSPYTEWYENSLRFPDSPASEHHRETYGDRPYRDLARDFVDGLDSWDPEAWAAAFRDAGARYVVLVTKHHDGFCLWPTAVANPHVPNWATRRDVVGELAEAVRAVGLRFGVYYSGGLDWTFDAHPLARFSDLLAAVPRGAYPAYAEAQVEELIARYRPDVLWNDISWPTGRSRLLRMLDHYLAAVPEGVVNDRWAPYGPAMVLAGRGPGAAALDAGVRAKAGKGQATIPPDVGIGDYRTPEYTVFDTVQSRPWESVRGMDHSFGFNRMSRPEHFVAVDELLRTVPDAAAKHGRLLLNVGPRGEDAQIPEPQLERLGALGRLFATNGSLLHGGRPWVRPAAQTADGLDLRFTAGDDEVRVFALGDPSGPELVIPDVGLEGPAAARWCTPGGERPSTVEERDGAVAIGVPADLGSHPVHALAVRGLRARSPRR